MRRTHDAPVGGVPDPARPRSFAARYGAGVHRGVALGGGGTFFVAWQLAYLETLARHAVDVGRADRLVGTSAGSIVAAALARGRLHRLFAGAEVVGRFPGIARVLLPAAVEAPSQKAALDRYLQAADSAPTTILAIGAGAREADTPPAHRIPRELAPLVGERWPSPALWMTTVDTETADRCVLTQETSVPVAHGAAASSAVPGIFAPQPVAGRTCMDGGACGTAVHLDLLAGADRALVLSLYRDQELDHGMLTLAPGDLTRELDGLRGGGTEVFFRAPERHPMDVAGLMDPAAVPDAMDMGARQAEEDLVRHGIAEFWR